MILLIDQKAFMWPLSLPRSWLDINRMYFWTSLSLSYKLSHENILWLLTILKIGNVFENNNYDARLGQCWSWMQWKGMMQGATPALSEIGLSTAALLSLFVICHLTSEVRKRKAPHTILKLSYHIYFNTRHGVKRVSIRVDVVFRPDCVIHQVQDLNTLRQIKAVVVLVIHYAIDLYSYTNRGELIKYQWYASPTVWSRLV